MKRLRVIVRFAVCKQTPKESSFYATTTVNNKIYCYYLLLLLCLCELIVNNYNRYMRPYNNKLLYSRGR